ncbi:MAG: EutN/CcmL family microcompartment protein [Deltaproteobacteria bacterium]|nr:EutN/CcmL family microcompartment protein [Deltaproteobacteria bacterium]
MYLARVIGTVVCTTKAENMKGMKLLVVQPCDKNRKPNGEPHVAADATQAGEGDLVTCVGSREAALAFSPSFVPVDAAIIGIVDAAD